jgi:hypothetical protein
MGVDIRDDDRAMELDKLVKDEKLLAELKNHLDELAEGAAFKGSHRSQQFLRYIVEKTLEGSFDSLKERMIGFELFQRPPSYDTGEDAIVRVTASDVRRRLLQHYGRSGGTSQFRINLLSGSYIPEIIYEPSTKVRHPQQEVVHSPAVEPHTHETELPSRAKIRWAPVAATVLAMLLLALAGVLFRQWEASRRLAAMLPWSTLFRPGHATQLITSDPNIEKLQALTGQSISVSDYANRNFLPAGRDGLSPELQQFYLYYLHADNAAAVDTPIAVSIARIVPDDFEIHVRSARSLRFTDLQTDDNLILLGSPRSNPWAELFAGQLDFRFVFSSELKQEVLQNIHVGAGEQAVYVPTALGFATGESFAIVALVQNPNQSGQVLLLAGANGEGTEAAGHLVADKLRLSRALEFCGVAPRGGSQNFELLLRLHTMAGSPGTVEMVACHHLQGH